MFQPLLAVSLKDPLAVRSRGGFARMPGSLPDKRGGESCAPAGDVAAGQRGLLLAPGAVVSKPRLLLGQGRERDPGRARGHHPRPRRYVQWGDYVVRFPPDPHTPTFRAGSRTSSSIRQTSARLPPRASTSTSSGAAPRRPWDSSPWDSTARTSSITRIPGSSRRWCRRRSARAARTGRSRAIGNTRSSTGPMGHGVRRWRTRSKAAIPNRVH